METQKQLETILEFLKNNSNESNRIGMGKFGIDISNALGVSIPVLRNLAKPYRKNHELAQELWKTSIHEARLMASMIDDPKKLTEKQIDEWSHDFKSWDLCDQVCMNLFSRSELSEKKILEYAQAEGEFVKRASFALIACYALKRMNKSDYLLIGFLPIIENSANDERIYVKKAVNWALRQIGKENIFLRKNAIECAERIRAQGTKSAKWIASDALRELNKTNL